MRTRNSPHLREKRGSAVASRSLWPKELPRGRMALLVQDGHLETSPWWHGLAAWAPLPSCPWQGIVALPQCHGLGCDRNSHVSWWSRPL